MLTRVSKFLGFQEGNEDILRLVKIMSTLGPLISATVTMSSTYYMIFVAEALGGGKGLYLEGIGSVGILIVIQLGIQTLLDYPTGGLGDWIGQRYVIASAYLCYGLAFFLTTFVNTGTQFTYLILIYALWGVAGSQESGAWQAWFDNNYRVAMPEDKERKEYGVFLGKYGMIIQIVSAAALIPGSILAVIIRRTGVFLLEAIICIIISIVVLRTVRDFPEVEASRTKASMTEYVTILKSGGKFLFSGPFVKWLIIGGMIISSASIAWDNIILFPLYFSYLLTDVAVASYRTTLLFPWVVSRERSGVWSKRFEPKKWIPRFRFMQTFGFVFYMLIAVIMFIFPPVLESATIVDITIPFTNLVIMSIAYEFLLPMGLVYLILVLTVFFGGFADILTSRILLDVIPDRIRNSVYSLIPTVALLFAIPQIILIGFILQYFGFSISLVILAIFSLLGVILIRKGLSHPIPIPEEVNWKSNDVTTIQERDDLPIVIDDTEESENHKE